MNEKKVIKKKKKLGSYPYVTVVFSISLALFALGLFGLLMLHVNKISTNLKNSFEVHVYLSDNLSDSQTKQFENLLASKKFVASTDGKKDIIFVSKEEAAKRFISETNEDFEEVLGYNPLKNAFKIKIDPKYTSPENIKSLKKNIEALNGVVEVEMVESLIHEINRRVRFVGLILLILSALLILVIFILINNTIKLALFSQRFLIRSMQLVGATASFIQLPYMRTSIMHGLIAGIVASVSLFLMMEYFYESFEELRLLQDNQSFMMLAGGLIVFGIIIGLLSSLLAVRKYLKMSLDDLY